MASEIEKHGDATRDDVTHNDTTAPTATQILGDDARLKLSETSVRSDPQPPVDKKADEENSPGGIEGKDEATSSLSNQANVDLATNFYSFIKSVGPFVPSYLLGEMYNLEDDARRLLSEKESPIKRYVSSMRHVILYTRDSP